MDATATPAAQVATRSSEENRGSHHDVGNQLPEKRAAAAGTCEKKANTTAERQIQPFELENAEQHPVDPEGVFPEGGLEAWLVVLSAFISLYPSFGFMVWLCFMGGICAWLISWILGRNWCAPGLLASKSTVPYECSRCRMDSISLRVSVSCRWLDRWAASLDVWTKMDHASG
jgi:hypothetical protein